MKKTAKQQGRASRQKGKRGEREVCAICRRYGIEAKRGYQSRGGKDEPDVVHTIPGVHMEVKRRETLSIWSALQQSEDEANEGEEPVVVFRRNQSRWYVALSFEKWLRQMGYEEVIHECDAVEDDLIC